MPKSPQVRMSTSSSRRTNSTAPSLGSKLRKSKMGYATSCPGPWKVTSPPRSMSNNSTPFCARNSGGAIIAQLGVAAEGYYRRMLQQQQGVVDAVGLAQFHQR